jgi:DNA replication protein DnaC
MSTNRKRKRSEDDSDDSEDYPKRKVVKKSVDQTPRAKDKIERGLPVAAETPYEKAKKSLHLSYAPHELLGREKEKEEIITFLKNKLDPKTREKAASSLYISGPPGTGKTQLTTKICSEIKSWVSYRTSLYELIVTIQNSRKLNNLSVLLSSTA